MKKSVALIFLMALAVSVRAQTTNYQVHSLFILNIAKYSTWPAHTSEFHIVVLGKSKVYEELLKHTAGKSINGVPMKVTQVDSPEDIGEAQIVVLSDGKSGSLSDINKATDVKPVMVIAEREGLYKKGAGFSFVVMDNNTLRYDINESELERRNIKISKNLSNLANLVI